MAVHIFIVTVETDHNYPNVYSAQTLANEIQSTLEFDSYRTGVEYVSVQIVQRDYRVQIVQRSYRQLVEGSHES